MFKVGDLVRVNCPFVTAHGRITTIVNINVRGFDISCGEYIGHEVDIPDNNNPGYNCAFEPHELIKIDDGERGSWDEIEKSTGWSPHKVLVQ